MQEYSNFLKSLHEETDWYDVTKDIDTPLDAMRHVVEPYVGTRIAQTMSAFQVSSFIRNRLEDLNRDPEVTKIVVFGFLVTLNAGEEDWPRPERRAVLLEQITEFAEAYACRSTGLDSTPESKAFIEFMESMTYEKFRHITRHFMKTFHGH